MGGTGKDNQSPKNQSNEQSPKKDDGKSSNLPPASTEDDDNEDGDFATPKRDRYERIATIRFFCGATPPHRYVHEPTVLRSTRLPGSRMLLVSEPLPR